MSAKVDEIINLFSLFDEINAENFCNCLSNTNDGLKAYRIITGTFTKNDFIQIFPFQLPNLEIRTNYNKNLKIGLYSIGNLSFKLNSKDDKYTKFNPFIALFTHNVLRRKINGQYFRLGKWTHCANFEYDDNLPFMPIGRQTEFQISDYNNWFNVSIKPEDWFYRYSDENEIFNFNLPIKNLDKIHTKSRGRFKRIDDKKANFACLPLRFAVGIEYEGLRYYGDMSQIVYFNLNYTFLKFHFKLKK